MELRKKTSVSCEHQKSEPGTGEVHHKPVWWSGHLEMIATIVHQLTRNMTMEQIKEAGFETYFVDHTAGVYAQAAAGFPFDALCFASKGDAITDLTENMAADGTTA